MIFHHLKPKLGLRIREERERLGLTQVQAAEATHVSRRAYMDYESEAFSPSIEWLSRFAKLGVDVDFILFGRRSSLDAVPLQERELREAFEFVDRVCRDAKGRLMSAELRIEQMLHVYRFIVSQKGLPTKEALEALEAIAPRTALKRK